MSPMTTPSPNVARPAGWKIAAALAVIYLSWGTTYLAIHEGVKTVPPFLFGGTRIGLAGALLLVGLAVCGQSVRISGRDLAWSWFVSLLLFLGGNGLINIAEQTVDSGLASVLVATTPLWMALLETLWPWGDRLTARGWLGVVAGLVGVAFLALPKIGHSGEAPHELWGYLIVLGSALTWAVGSFAQRYRRTRAPALVAAAYQMMLGGASMVLLGGLLRETGRVSFDSLTPGAVWAFCHLLIVGSLVGYVTYAWLLGHVSTTVAGTYAYVNPVVALLVGAAVGERVFQWPVVTGVVVILAGVALVRRGGVTQPLKPAQSEVAKERTPRSPHVQATAASYSRPEARRG
jgi:drug/metabolite transporter (DMT)-like permease